LVQSDHHHQHQRIVDGVEESGMASYWKISGMTPMFLVN
jgi:hypothetical protein